MPTNRDGAHHSYHSGLNPSENPENFNSDAGHKPLTRRQIEVLKAVQQHIEKNGFPPSQRELAAGLGISAVHAVEKHLAALERKGYLRRGKGARALSLPDVVFGRSVP